MNKNDQNKKSLKISYYKGIFGCCMTGFTQEYFTPFLLHLAAAVTQIGVFNRMRPILGVGHQDHSDLEKRSSMKLTILIS